MHVIRAPRVVADSVPLGPACVAVSDGVIVGVVAGETYGGVRPDVDLPSGVLVPGLVDLQINGCFGVDFVAADPAELGRRCPAGCRRPGVTAFLPTFITAPVPELAAALRRTAALPARPRRRARARRARGGPVPVAPTGTARTTRPCCATRRRRRSTR